MFLPGKTSQSFEYLQAYNPMNYVSLSCPMSVDGRNNMVFKPNFTLPEFKIEDSNVTLELFKNPFSLINLNPPLAMPFKRALQNKKHQWETHLRLEQITF